jgi:hypothetical protein
VAWTRSGDGLCVFFVRIDIGDRRRIDIGDRRRFDIGDRRRFDVDHRCRFDVDQGPYRKLESTSMIDVDSTSMFCLGRLRYLQSLIIGLHPSRAYATEPNKATTFQIPVPTEPKSGGIPSLPTRYENELP